MAERRRVRRARPPKTAMVVAQRIVEDISRQKSTPGTVLPSEKDMLVGYDVGRGTLRESLRFLEMNGVITMKPGPGGGPVVGEPDARDLAGTLGLFLQLHGTPFRAIFEVRHLLEPAIAAQAAERADAECLERIRRSVETMENHLGDEALFLEENENFHELVAWGSQNPVFALLICSLHWITDGSPLGVDYPERRRKAVAAAHRGIYEALAAGDPAAAEQAMRRHVTEFGKYLARYYASIYDSPVRWSQIAL